MKDERWKKLMKDCWFSNRKQKFIDDQIDLRRFSKYQQNIFAVKPLLTLIKRDDPQ